MPLHEVTVGGAPYVSAGSTRAYCARMKGAAIPVFVWVSSSAITMPPETSEPDPAVVGIATSGSARADSARSTSAATVWYGRPTLCARRAAFARSITEPPPIAITMSAPTAARAALTASASPDVGSPGGFTCRVTSLPAPSTDASAAATPGRSPATGSRIRNGRRACSDATTDASSLTTPSPNRMSTGSRLRNARTPGAAPSVVTTRSRRAAPAPRGASPH